MDLFKRCFNTITSDEIDELQQYFKAMNYKGSSYTFMANYIWRNSYQICWEIIKDYLFIGGMSKASGEMEAIVSMPLTKTGSYDHTTLREALLEVKARFDKQGIPFSIRVIPQHLLSQLQIAFDDKLDLESKRADEEYIYEKEKLITLSGKALHKKKNHLNYFLKNFSYEARTLTSDDGADIMKLLKSFMRRKKPPLELLEKVDYMETLDEDSYDLSREESFALEDWESLKFEYDAIKEAVSFLGMPDIYGVGIYIDGQLEAFSIGERLGEDLAVAHFEKANTSFRGIYQGIAREFCLALPEEIKFVNREEDMGIPALRQAKEALRPVEMLKKYTAIIKEPIK